MFVVVLSDTHVPDFAGSLPAALTPALRRADTILHAGDVTSVEVLDELAAFGAPVHVALGNNDRTEVSAWGAADVVELELDGVSLAMLHDSGPREGREGRLRRRFPTADVVVFGHSHIPVDILTADGVRLFNPGSATWKRRQLATTYGEMTIAGGRVATRIVGLPATTSRPSG